MAFMWKEWGKQLKDVVRINDVPVVIRTKHLPNTKLQRSRYITLLGVMVGFPSGIQSTHAYPEHLPQCRGHGLNLSLFKNILNLQRSVMPEHSMVTLCCKLEQIIPNVSVPAPLNMVSSPKNGFEIIRQFMFFLGNRRPHLAT